MPLIPALWRKDLKFKATAPQAKRLNVYTASTLLGFILIVHPDRQSCDVQESKVFLNESNFT